MPPIGSSSTRWWDPALALALTSGCLVELFARPELQSDSLRASVALILAGAPIAVRRSHPVAAACAQAAVVVTTPFDDRLPQSAEVLIAVVAYSCGAHASRRRGLLGVAALIVGMQVGVGFSEFPNVEITFVTLGAAILHLVEARRVRRAVEKWFRESETRPNAD